MCAFAMYAVVVCERRCVAAVDRTYRISVREYRLVRANEMRACAKVAVELGCIVALCAECVERAEVRLCCVHVIVVEVVNYLGW